MFKTTRTHWYRCTARLLAVVLMTSTVVGCANMPASSGPLTPAQQALRQQTTRFNETVATGAVAGALLGGIAMALLSDNRNRARNVALGAAAGAAVGGTAGYYVATSNQNYASAEQEYDAKLAAVEREVTSYRAISDSSQAVVTENKIKISLLQDAYGKRTMTAAEVQRSAATMQEDLKQLRLVASEKAKVMSGVSQDITRFQAQGKDVRGLQAAQAQLAQSQIESNVDELARALAGLPAA